MTDEFKALNSQVIEAVAAVRQGIEKDWGSFERSMTATATRHACAITLQDAVDHLRHIETLATAATARALAQMASGERIEESEKVLEQARASVKAALDNVTEVVAKLAPLLATDAQGGAGDKP